MFEYSGKELYQIDKFLLQIARRFFRSQESGVISNPVELYIWGWGVGE